MTGPLRTSQTEKGSVKNKKLINVSLESISWIVKTCYFTKPKIQDICQLFMNMKNHEVK